MWFKKIDSEEYLKLHKRIEELRITIEALKLELQLYKNKLRGKVKIEETDTAKDIYNGALLGENGNTL